MTWNTQCAWCHMTDFQKNYDEGIVNKSLKLSMNVGELAALGFKSVKPLKAANAPASAIRLEGEWGTEYWLGLHNFYVIGRYNPRAKYAMAVFQ